jgi:hypothetical protein
MRDLAGQAGRPHGRAAFFAQSYEEKTRVYIARYRR